MASDLTEAQKSHLCDAGAAAWKVLNDEAARVHFVWRDTEYAVTYVAKKLRIETPAGVLVTGRYD
jgi:hypothetical protein